MKNSNRINEFKVNFPNLTHFLQLQETEKLPKKYPGVWKLSLPYMRIIEEALNILQQNPKVFNSQRIKRWQTDLENLEDTDNVLSIITEMEIAKELVKQGATVFFEEPVYETGKNIDLKVGDKETCFFVEVKTRSYIESKNMRWKKVVTEELEQEIREKTGRPTAIYFIRYSDSDFVQFKTETLRKDFIAKLSQAVLRDFTQKAPNVYCQHVSKDYFIYCIRYSFCKKKREINISRLDRNCKKCKITTCKHEPLWCPINQSYKYIEVWLNYPIRDERVFYASPSLQIPSQESGQNQRTYIDKVLEKFEKKLPDGRKIFRPDIASKYQPLIGYFNYVEHDNGTFFLDLNSDDYQDTVRDTVKYYKSIFRECRYKYISGVLIAYTIASEDNRFKKVFVYNKWAKKLISAEIVKKFIKPDHVINL